MLREGIRGKKKDTWPLLEESFAGCYKDGGSGLKARPIG